jgi:hypothetical protein
MLKRNQKTILKQILKTRDVKMWSGLGLSARFCENGNETSGSIKRREFDDYRLFTEQCAIIT